MRALAVIPVAASVLRTELLQLNQGRGEHFRSFAARVRGKAETCSFHTGCSCGRNVDYTDNVIRDVLLCGMSDLDIRREMLGTKDILEASVNDVIALVENKEMARKAFPLSAVSAASSFKRQRGSVVTQHRYLPKHGTIPAGPVPRLQEIIPSPQRRSQGVEQEAPPGLHRVPPSSPT